MITEHAKAKESTTKMWMEIDNIRCYGSQCWCLQQRGC